MSNITKDLGGITAYADAVAGGYTGTKAQWETLMASYASVAQDAEAYAVGKRGGVDVTSGDPAYHNNSKYYSTQAASSATAASGSATAAASSATAAAASASAIAATYDSTKTYAVGEYCLYNGGMYVCTTAITVAEAWTAGHWSAVKVGTELTALKEDINDLQDGLDKIFKPELDTTIKTGYFISSTGVVSASANAAYAEYISVIPSSDVTVNFTISFEPPLSQNHNIRIHGYKADKTWDSQLWYKEYGTTVTGTTCVTIHIPSNIHYLQISFGRWDVISNFWVAYDGYIRPYEPDFVQIQYPIDRDGHYTKGRIVLPTSYEQYGKPVPLIVYVHASNGFYSMDGNIYANDTGRENLEYLVNCGYALFDCFAFGSVYNISAANTWGLPINRKCYKAGIEYVLRNYNIDKDNIFCSTKSLGGLQALSMFFDEGIPIKGFGLLAPALNVFNLKLGYISTEKHIYATELNFSEDTGHVLDFDQGDPVPEGFWDYITENMDKWSGWASIYNGLPIKKSDKPTYYEATQLTKDMCRFALNRPMKIWHAADDSTVQYSYSAALIESLVNGGNIAQLRTMPNGTGGHTSVDISDDRLMTSDVTTRLGVHYDAVTTAYYELAEWFDSLCTSW